MTSTLNLEDRNVIIQEATVEEIREESDEFHERVDGWLDETQGLVYGGDHQMAWLVIRVTAAPKQDEDKGPESEAEDSAAAE